MKISARTERTNKLLLKKMIEYLFPTMLTMAALSLNEFVDSMLVSNLLGSEAMAVVGLGSPIMMIFAATYTLLGNGGATLYALSLGKRDTDTAAKAFRLSIAAAMAVGLLAILAGFVFFNPICRLLCSDPLLMDAFKPYFRALLFSAPFIITILTLVEFLPPSGAPKIATAVNLVANIVNLGLDYIYIRFFNMGVEGAAYATLSGYIVAALIVAFVVLRRKVNIPKARIKRGDFRILGEILGFGSPSAVSQLGFALKFAFCNGQAILYGGTAGVVAYSLCNQTISIVSIFLAALVGASIPLIAVLHGQRDFRGENSLLKTVMVMNAVLAVLCFAGFWLFAAPLADMYNITDSAELALAVKAVRIFSIMYLARGFYMIFMKYLQVSGRKLYSMFISVFDGFGGIIVVAYIMGKLLGIDGLWYAFPITSFILLAIMLIWNRSIVRRSNGAVSGLLLASCEDKAEKVFDVTIFEDGKSISDISKALQNFCTSNGIDVRSATHAALCVEEMAVYTRNHHKKNDYIDILARLYEDRIEIDFRSLGNSFNPLVVSDGDIAENIQLLNGIASKLEYTYIMGMNCSRITILRKTGADVV